MSLDRQLERALAEAPRRLDVPKHTPDAEKLRAYARLGYEQTLADELDEERLATYRAWAAEKDMGRVAQAASRRAARRGVFENS